MRAKFPKLKLAMGRHSCQRLQPFSDWGQTALETRDVQPGRKDRLCNLHELNPCRRKQQGDTLLCVILARKGTARNSRGRDLRNSVPGYGVLVWLGLGVLSCSFPIQAQSQQPSLILAEERGPRDVPGTRLPAGAQQLDPQSSATVKGTVVDPTGNPVVGAQVKLTGEAQSPGQQVLSDDDGQFFIFNVAPGPFRLTITSAGFATQTLSGTLSSGETCVVPQITLAVATVMSEVEVVESRTEVAEEQIKEQEKQRVLGIIPNFYVSYVADAVPLTSKQKFKLAWKSSVDPITFGITGAVAGIEQARDSFNGYGQGAQGYGKRYGAAYGDAVIGTFIGSAVLPSILKQDPRYFYKGTGSKRSRILYAMANAVICKGDNGHWQANYSSILGGLAAGGISNLYYPSQHNETELTFENALIGIGSTAAANILQEFVVRKLTPNLPKHAQPDP